MSFLELFGWVLIVVTAVSWITFMLGWLWAKYCSWAIQRERDLFWLALQRKFIERDRLARIRYIPDDHPYR